MTNEKFLVISGAIYMTVAVANTFWLRLVPIDTIQLLFLAALAGRLLWTYRS